MLTVNKFDRLDMFLEKLKVDIYPEPLMNEYFIEDAIKSIEDKIKPDQKVLDIGCGHGYAMDIFKKHGVDVKGITLSNDDREIAIKRGHDVEIMDMSFTDYNDNQFNGIFARHCLEHSIFPYYTLSEFHRILKPNGWLYVELPAPNTGCHHETNPNHYSVFDLTMAGNLVFRAGFRNIDTFIIDLKVTDDLDDRYYRIIGDK